MAIKVRYSKPGLIFNTKPMNNIKNRMIDTFAKHLKEQYEVWPSLARHLFDRWDILNRCEEYNIEQFVKSEEVEKVFIIAPGINNAKKYFKDDFKRLGTTLEEIDAEKHLYKDSKFGYTWGEEWNGHGDCWNGSYTLKEPVPNDSHLAKEDNE